MPSRLRVGRAALPLLAVLLLAGCSLLPADRIEADSAAREAEIRRAALTAWQFKGRIRTPDQRASLRWRQQQQQFDLLLRGPFGFGGVRIVGNPERVEIDDGEERVVSEQPVLDIYRRTGLLVPVAALPYWALGLPAPGSEARLERDAAGFIAQIEQAGWQIVLEDYQSLDGLMFPHQIVLQHDQQVFEISVGQWKLL